MMEKENINKEQMKVGVLFCGGCNPYFERTDVYNEIKEHFADRLSFSYYSQDETYHYVLLINGCQSECLMHDAYNGKLIVINNLNYMDALEKIELMLKEDANS